MILIRSVRAAPKGGLHLSEFLLALNNLDKKAFLSAVIL
jgi:hypothetical protein